VKGKEEKKLRPWKKGNPLIRSWGYLHHTYRVINFPYQEKGNARYYRQCRGGKWEFLLSLKMGRKHILPFGWFLWEFNPACTKKKQVCLFRFTQEGFIYKTPTKVEITHSLRRGGGFIRLPIEMYPSHLP